LDTPHHKENPMRLRLTYALVALMLVPLVRAADDPSAPAGWKEYSPKDKSFSVLLPEKSNRRSERERTMTVRGQRIKVNIIHVEVGGIAYEAATFLLPAPLTRKVPAGQRLEIVRDIFLDLVKGKVKEDKDIKQGRVPGKEYLIETRSGMARLQAYAAGGRLYQVSVLGTKEQIESKDAETFLGSYKLPEKATGTTTDKDK
jgi:hypothetical protein